MAIAVETVSRSWPCVFVLMRLAPIGLPSVAQGGNRNREKSGEVPGSDPPWRPLPSGTSLWLVCAESPVVAKNRKCEDRSASVPSWLLLPSSVFAGERRRFAQSDGQFCAELKTCYFSQATRSTGRFGSNAPMTLILNIEATAVPPFVDAAQHERLLEYLGLLLRENEKFNLTAIAEPHEAWNRHVLENLQLAPLLGAGANLIDVGSGGGLPGMVLAIARPELQVTLLEATAKKARFLEQAARSLGLSNVSVVCDRAETAAKPGSRLREHFDLVTARAVAPLRVLLELTAPFAKVQGVLVAVKGEQATSELELAAKALSALSVSLETTVRQATATVLLFRKQAPTLSKFPRRPGEPKRNPL